MNSVMVRTNVTRYPDRLMAGDKFKPVMLAKMSKRDLEDRFLELLHENMTLKKLTNQQTDKIRILTTKLKRSTSMGAEKDKEGQIRCKVAHDEQKETVLELNTVIIRQREVIKKLRLQLSSAKQFLRAPRRIQKNVSSTNMQFQKDVTTTVSGGISSAAVHKSSKGSPDPNVVQRSRRGSPDVPPAVNRSRIESPVTTAVHRSRIKSPLSTVVPHNNDSGVENLKSNNTLEDAKFKEILEEMKNKISLLQEEQEKTKKDYLTHISELEKKLKDVKQEKKILAEEMACLSQQCELKERACRETLQKLRAVETKCDDLSMKYSLERGKVDELLMQIKSVNLSAHVAKTIEEHLNQQMLRLIPAPAKEVTVLKEPKTNDDSGYIDQNMSPSKEKKDEREELLIRQKSDQLHSRIATLQKELNAWSSTRDNSPEDKVSVAQNDTFISVKEESDSSNKSCSNKNKLNYYLENHMKQEKVCDDSNILLEENLYGQSPGNNYKPQQTNLNHSVTKDFSSREDSYQEMSKKVVTTVYDENIVITENIQVSERFDSKNKKLVLPNFKMKAQHDEHAEHSKKYGSFNRIKEKIFNTLKADMKSVDKVKPVETGEATPVPNKFIINNNDIISIPNKSRKKKLHHEKVPITKQEKEHPNEKIAHWKVDVNETGNRQTMHIIEKSPDNTDNEILTMSDLPEEPEPRLITRAPSSPGELKAAELLYTCGDSMLTVTEDSRTLSEGEVQMRTDPRLIDKNEENQPSSSQSIINIESVMNAIKEELSKCQNLLSVHRQEMHAPMMASRRRIPSYLFIK